jgi:O-methyltransferase
LLNAVYGGGNILLYKLLKNHYGLNKNIYAFDTFDGMTLPDNLDKDYLGNSASLLLKKTVKKNNKGNIHCYSDIDTVKKNILQYSNLDNIKFIKGPVEKTLLLEVKFT